MLPGVGRVAVRDGGRAAPHRRSAAPTPTRRLAGALAKLSAGERDVLLLAAWADLGCEEHAAGLDVPLGTVRSRLSRARATVRAALEEHPGD